MAAETQEAPADTNGVVSPAVNGHSESSNQPKAQDKTSKEKSSSKSPPGGFDDTPLPDAPQGYTLRILFESAANLSPADVHTAASDPYILATLKAANPKRHKEDPELRHRTRTVRNTTEPNWHEEWIVANVPASGFTLKCRLYDEDPADHDDRLGNVTIRVPQLYEGWEGFPAPGREFAGKKRMISKRAFVMKGIKTILHSNMHMTPRLTVAVEVLGKSDPPYAQMCTIGPTRWIKHYSPLIGRLAGVRVNKDEEDDRRPTSSQEEAAHEDGAKGKKKKQTGRYDFQANEMQLQGPVPSKLYHRYVEFRPIIGSMFASTGIRGKILNFALHKQHNRIYNYDSTTEYGDFEACSRAAAVQFLRLAHYDQGSRTFTYVLTLDGLFRFTETGKEFGIDLLSKHTMHSDVDMYIACSGEFFIRRRQHHHHNSSGSQHEISNGQASDDVPADNANSEPPADPSLYQLVIDNDSGTYRPDKSVLPLLGDYLRKNFPGLDIVTMHCEEEKLQKAKEAQRKAKKTSGHMINLVLNKSQSSLSSAESDLAGRDDNYDDENRPKTTREAAYDALEDPRQIKGVFTAAFPHRKKGDRSSAAADKGKSVAPPEGPKTEA